MCHKRAREEADHLSYVALAFSKDMVSEPGGLERFGESGHTPPSVHSYVISEDEEEHSFGHRHLMTFQAVAFAPQPSAPRPSVSLRRLHLP